MWYRTVAALTLCGELVVAPPDRIWLTFTCPGAGVKGQKVVYWGTKTMYTEIYEIQVLGNFKFSAGC